MLRPYVNRRASGDAWDDRHGVTRPDRRVMLPQLPDVPVVHVHVDETAQSSVVCKEVPPQGGVLAGQPLQQFAHAGGIELDRVPPPREGAERHGDQDRDCHATVRSSMLRGAAANDARSSVRIHAFTSPALRPATAAITYTSRGHAWSRSYCEGMGGWSGCECYTPMMSSPSRSSRCCARRNATGSMMYRCRAASMTALGS